MRLIDADALAKDLEYDIELDSRALDCTDFVGVERERTLFDKICKQNCMWHLTESPTIYAVPVVRCRECEGWVATENSDLGLCVLTKRVVTRRDYCSEGKRKDGDRDG